MKVCRAVYSAAAVVVGLAVLSLSGCASLLPGPQAGARAQPFDVLGRVLVNYQGNGLTANVRWLHGANADEIWLMTPTGQALAHIREDGDGALLTTAEQKQYRALRVESLTQQALGWALPAGHLQHWLRGVAAPDKPVEITERDAAGKIRQLTQNGWRVTFDYYAAAENGGLPRRLEVVGAAQTIRLVIDTWRTESP
jgi:outer membrane lipoprotein LolB